MNQVIGMLGRALDMSALRQNSISNNIANVDTPNFQPTEVSFDEVFQQELNSTFAGNRTNKKHLSIGKTDQLPEIQTTKKNMMMKNNGNGVDLDYEMSEMSKNSLWYQSLTYGLNQEFSLLRMSIKGRG